MRLPNGEREKIYREMYRLYSEEGWTLWELADEWGLSRSAVGDAFHRRGWRVRPGNPPARGEDPMITEEDRLRRDRRMLELYEEGWTLQELADEYGLNVSKVHRIFEIRGWPRRRTGPRSLSD